MSRVFHLALRGKTADAAARRRGRVADLLAVFPVGSEFMPPLDEGDLLYMPTTDPSISITKAREISPADRQADHGLPRSETRLRQGGAGRYAHRPRRAEHAGNHHCLALGQVPLADAADRTLVFRVPRLGQSSAGLFLAGGAHDHLERTDLWLEPAERRTHPRTG